MIVAIDTGGSKTLISSFNAHGRKGDLSRFPTPHNPDEYVRLLKESVELLYAHEKVEVIVVAIPGVIRDGTVKWCGNLPWKNLHLADLLKDLLPGVPVLLENDAKLAGLGEARSMATVPETALYVTISTGIGAGLIADGKIDRGMRFSEVGRMPLEYDGVVRIWESFASGQAIVGTYRKYARDITSKRTWRQIADRMSRGFLVMIPAMQPDIIIIGGSVGTYFARYEQFLKELIKERLPEHIPCPKIIQAKHPEEAVLYGCYYYAIDSLADKKSRKK